MHKTQLDGLRFVGFAAVFLYHTDIERFWAGSFGVPLFFALSGFLITGILLRHEGPARGAVLRCFYARRFLRIFPAYYLLVAVLLLAGWIRQPSWYLLYLFNIKIFLASLRDQLPPLLDAWRTNGIHFWTLSVEEQYYLLYPLILFCTPARFRSAVFAALLAGSIGCRLFFINFMPASFYGTLLPVCGEYLIWGALGAYLESRRPLTEREARLLVYGGLALFAMLILAGGKPPIPGYAVQFQPLNLQTFYAVSFAALVWGLWKAPNTLPARLLSLPPLAYLGKISYGLYLVHLFTWAMAARVSQIFPALSALRPELLRLALTVGLASLSWHCFESPVNSLKKHFPYPGARHAVQ